MIFGTNPKFLLILFVIQHFFLSIRYVSGSIFEHNT